ncbi:MAG: HopJ type III effector protein [Spongiibacteraceae bacterium]
MSIPTLLKRLRNAPESVEFPRVIETINAHYEYTPTRFTNGVGADCVVNAAGTNEGSCRVFAFAKLNDLSEAETLALFGQFYRDVLDTPDGTDHANIRTFMRHGWQGIRFETAALKAKNIYIKE